MAKHTNYSCRWTVSFMLVSRADFWHRGYMQILGIESVIFCIEELEDASKHQRIKELKLEEANGNV